MPRKKVAHQLQAPDRIVAAKSHKRLRGAKGPPKVFKTTTQESEERFRLLFEQAADGIFLADSNGHYLDVNRAGCAMFGYSQEEIVSRSIADLVAPEEREKIGPHVALFADGRVTTTEWRFVRKDGSVFLGEVVSRQLPDGRLQAIVKDVTERKAAEEALRERDERLRKLADNLPESAVYQYVRKVGESIGRFTYLSAGVEKITGVKVEDALRDASQLHGLILPGYLERLMAEEARCIREMADFEIEVPMRRMDGEVRWMSIRSRPRQLACGTLVWDGVQTDITERKRGEAALRKSEERFRALVTASSDVVYRMSADWSEMRELHGRSFVADSPTPNRNWLEVYIPAEDRSQVMAVIQNAMRSRRVFELEHRMIRADGTVGWTFSRAVPLLNENGDIIEWFGAASDVTERKEAESEVARYREQLERLVSERTAKLQELVGELEHFSYTITHDLKAPLRAMRGFAEVAGQVCGQTEAKPLLDKISTAAERMDALIRDALNYSQAVRQELPLEDVDTGALLRGILDSYPQFQPWRAQVVIKGQLPVVMGNEAGLTQCLSNLLGNAVKFVKPGQTPKVRIYAETPAGRHGWTRLWVEDNGIGIPPEMLPRLFHMFARVSKEYEGTGIGLALVRKVVQRMGGRVGVESEEGKGSRFWIELKTGTAQPVQEQILTVSSGSEGGTILYVEDEEHDATFMQMAFATKGMESALRVVQDGRMAIEYLSGAGKYRDRNEFPVPVVVLLDLNLPLIPGFEVLEWMRNHPDFEKTPVVVFSSSSREDDRERARELGADDFVAKPNSGMEFGVVVDALRERWLVRRGAKS